MKNFLLGALAILAFAPYALAVRSDLPEREAINHMRPCAPLDDATPTLVAATAAAAAGASLTANTTYQLVCRQDAWLQFGDASVTAAPNDIFCPANTILVFQMNRERDNISARNVSVDGDVILWECS